MKTKKSPWAWHFVASLCWCLPPLVFHFVVIAFWRFSICSKPGQGPRSVLTKCGGTRSPRVFQPGSSSHICWSTSSHICWSTSLHVCRSFLSLSHCISPSRSSFFRSKAGAVPPDRHETQPFRTKWTSSVKNSGKIAIFFPILNLFTRNGRRTSKTQETFRFFFSILNLFARNGRRTSKTQETLRFFLNLEPFRTKRTSNVKNWGKINYDFPIKLSTACAKWTLNIKNCCNTIVVLDFTWVNKRVPTTS